MEELGDSLNSAPMGDGQRVLALTFMHGSRRRVDGRLRAIQALETRYECTTVDSFALRIVRRWQALAAHIRIVVPDATDFNAVCDLAATLLEHDAVVRWVARTFPKLVLDEAQDLTPGRLRIIRALAVRLDLFVAADEFQCLDPALRPNPACDWLAREAQVEELNTPQRTNVPGLLDAARAIRAGTAPTIAREFNIQLTPRAALAGTFLANELGWYSRNRSVAIITPSVGRFATDVVAWVGSRTTNQNNGPYVIEWEQSERDRANELVGRLVIADGATLAAAGAAVEACGNRYVTHAVAGWLDIQRRARGRTIVTRMEIEVAIRQALSLQRRTSTRSGTGFLAMSVHGAKNREFDNVIVLWPAAIVGNDDQKRRLLYNAITRAKRRCLRCCARGDSCGDRAGRRRQPVRQSGGKSVRAQIRKLWDRFAGGRGRRAHSAQTRGVRRTGAGAWHRDREPRR
jgi:hypothetical protein